VMLSAEVPYAADADGTLITTTVEILSERGEVLRRSQSRGVTSVSTSVVIP
jgi:hypothetical protein